MGEAWAGEGGVDWCVVGRLPALSPACPPVSPPSSDLQGGASAGCISPGLPLSMGPPFGSDMDFSPPRPPYPSIPEDPAYETPYLSEGFSYGTPPLYPQTRAPHHPTDPACGCSLGLGVPRLCPPTSSLSFPALP